MNYKISNGIPQYIAENPVKSRVPDILKYTTTLGQKSIHFFGKLRFHEIIDSEHPRSSHVTFFKFKFVRNKINHEMHNTFK